MRIASWNLNHKTLLKAISSQAIDGLLSLNPDVIVLNEYVHGPSRTVLLDRLRSHGLSHHLVSDCTPNENHVLIAARNRLECGSIRAPEIAPSVPSNALHVVLPVEGFDILGMRVPDYSRDPKIKRACWDWIHSTAESVKDHPFVMIGDFNTDTSYPASRCGDRIARLVAEGWQHAVPSEGGSYWTPNGSRPCRIDHAFVSKHFTVIDSKYVTEFDGCRFIGIDQKALSDHAILLIDIEPLEELPGTGLVSSGEATVQSRE